MRLLVNFVLISFLVSATNSAFSQNKCTIPDELQQKIDEISVELKKSEASEDQKAKDKLQWKLKELNDNVEEIKSRSKLTLEMKPTKESFAVSEPKTFRLIWTNISKEPAVLNLSWWNWDLWPEYLNNFLSIFNEKGEWLCCSMLSFERYYISSYDLTASPQDTSKMKPEQKVIKLQPNENYETVVTLRQKEYYRDIWSPGKYKIQIGQPQSIKHSECFFGYNTCLAAGCYAKPAEDITIEIK